MQFSGFAYCQISGAGAGTSSPPAATLPRAARHPQVARGSDEIPDPAELLLHHLHRLPQLTFLGIEENELDLGERRGQGIVDVVTYVRDLPEHAPKLEQRTSRPPRIIDVPPNLGQRVGKTHREYPYALLGRSGGRRETPPFAGVRHRLGQRHQRIRLHVRPNRQHESRGVCGGISEVGGIVEDLCRGPEGLEEAPSLPTLRTDQVERQGIGHGFGRSGLLGPVESRSRGIVPPRAVRAPALVAMWRGSQIAAMLDRYLLDTARGDRPGSVCLKGGRVLNVFTGEEEALDVVLHGDRIAALGTDLGAAEVVKLEGAWVLPGFIDAHVHIESSMVTPPEFARAVVRAGTTTVVADPHEIANVHGAEGVRYMLDASEGLPLSVIVMAPSCVPATSMSTSGAALDALALEALARHPRVLGLAEVMNFPGVIQGDPDVLAKLEAFRGRPVDGHAPGVRGRALAAYVAAGPGSDHECTTADEAIEKMRRGLFVFFREATNAHNLDALLPALTTANARRVALCTDDRQPGDLLREGGIDTMLRRVIAAGIPPADAVRLATLNPAGYFGLRDRGAVAPGRRADLVIVEDLPSLRIREVWSGGRVAARAGRPLPWAVAAPRPPRPSMRIDVERLSFRIEGRGRAARAIEVVPDQLVTRTRIVEPTEHGGEVVADPARDILKIAVIERHTGSGRVGLGLVTGMGLRRGAIAGSVAHDHHNIISVGADDASMLRAVAAVVEAGGGLAVAEGDTVIAVLPLPVGGLMSERPVEEVTRVFDALLESTRALGSPLHDPFMAMSFLGLEVIPELKITDRGLVDVEAFRQVPLWV